MAGDDEAPEPITDGTDYAEPGGDAPLVTPGAVPNRPDEEAAAEPAAPSRVGGPTGEPAPLAGTAGMESPVGGLAGTSR